MPNKTLPKIIATGSKPDNVMSAKTMDQLVELERWELEHSRLKSGTSKPTVQMSVRMDEEEYLRFRALCKAERRTNGDMVERLMKSYLGEGSQG
jgi:hypothetical protein